MSVAEHSGAASADSTAVDEALDAEIAQESQRVFGATQWTSPIGTLASSWLFSVFAQNSIAQIRLGFWFIAMLGVTLVGIAAHSVPLFKTRTNAEGLPRLSAYADVATGILFGLTLWLDLDATRDPTFRWTGLAFLFAVSATTAHGRPSMSAMALRVVFPIWILAGTALLVVGKPLPAVACFLFTGLLVLQLSLNRSLIRELIALRIRSNKVAQRSEWAASHDSLTGLVNRTGLMEALRERTLDPRARFTAMFIDLDHFKQVNDRFGHAAGDEVLLETATRLGSCLRPDDTICRLGGDEFVVLLGPDAKEGASKRLAERVIATLEQPVVVTDNEGRRDEAFVSASIGLARYPEDAASPGELINNADQALYVAKRQGRRRSVGYEESDQDEIAAASQVESALRRAIHMGEIEADAQPIYSLATGEIIWVELFARFRMPSGERVPPSVFVPLADEIGLAGDLMARMIEIAADIVPTWEGHDLLSSAMLGINASPIQLARDTMVRQVTESLQKTGIDPSRLVLEICESGAIDMVTNTKEQLEAVSNLGVRLAIHDFGVGYSSPNELLDLPLAAVKLNRRLLTNIEQDKRHLDMLHAVCLLAGAIAATVVAEGIETDEQVTLINDLGINAAQGYHLGRPVPVDQLADQLSPGETQA